MVVVANARRKPGAAEHQHDLVVRRIRRGGESRRQAMRRSVCFHASTTTETTGLAVLGNCTSGMVRISGVQKLAKRFMECFSRNPTGPARPDAKGCAPMPRD